MQIMPDTGAWIAEQMGIKNFDPHGIYRTDANIRLGCWYLGELEYEFQRNWVLMMIAYNAGRGNTKRGCRKIIGVTILIESRIFHTVIHVNM